MTHEPTVHGTYYVTGHQYAEVREQANEQTMVRVNLHRAMYQAGEAPAHHALVKRENLSHPAYALGAKWELRFTGQNRDDEDWDF